MAPKQAGMVRIIGGQWRGTRLPVPDAPGLRPSGDRGRETLFNWLQVPIRGARCADLFAGSGALGLEAASRGAGHVVLLETYRPAAKSLSSVLERLSADNAEVINDDALAWLETCPAAALDIVFMDPPFGKGLEHQALEIINRNDLVAECGFLYLESAWGSPPLEPGKKWLIHREKRIGEVLMQLFKKN